MADLLALTTLDTFEVAGRGTAHVVQLPAGEAARAMIGREVLLDGHRVVVRGVETFVVPDGHAALDGPCALLVAD